MMLCFSACSDDDEGVSGGGKSLVGTWTIPDGDDDYDYEMTFAADGTFSDIESVGDKSSIYRVKGIGTYKVSGNTYTTYISKEKRWDEDKQVWIDAYVFDEPETDTYTFEIDGNKLTIIEDSGDVERFVRK